MIISINIWEQSSNSDARQSPLQEAKEPPSAPLLLTHKGSISYPDARHPVMEEKPTSAAPTLSTEEALVISSDEDQSPARLNGRKHKQDVIAMKVHTLMNLVDSLQKERSRKTHHQAPTQKTPGGDLSSSTTPGHDKVPSQAGTRDE